MPRKARFRLFGSRPAFWGGFFVSSRRVDFFVTNFWGTAAKMAIALEI
jgi:hypothetical protein